MHDDVGRATEALTFRAPPVPARPAAPKSPVRVDAADRATERFYARVDSNVDLQIKTGQINDEEDRKVEEARRRVGAPCRESDREPTSDPIREDTKRSPDEIMAVRLRAAFTEGRRS